MTRRILLLVVAPIVALAAVAVTWMMATDRTYAGRVLPGVRIEGALVSGLGASQLAARIQALAGPALARPVTLKAVAHEVTLTASALGVTPDVARTSAAALAVGRTGSLLDRLRDRAVMLRIPTDVRIVYQYDAVVARDAIARFVSLLVVEPQDAAVTVTRGRLTVVSPSQDGVVVDIPLSTVRLIAALVHWQPEVRLAFELRRPAFITEMADQMAEPVAQFTTTFAYNPDRVHNIRLAASALRGLLLPPGALLSYNQVVGPRLPERGYRKAPVLINNELVPGDGGGVCQVSSTLFNAALLADMAVESRTNHSRPVPYLAAGRDATVEYGSIDLRLRNTTGRPLFLWTEVSSRSLTVSIFGAPQPGREVAIIVTDQIVIPAPSHTVVKRDAEIPAGESKIEPARSGLRSRTVRVVRQEGRVVRQEVVAANYYQPTPRTIKMGTGEPPRKASNRNSMP
ncbi:MAG: hypothetical protein A2Z07_04705 [Armatimonadetes bacterium RBG_16_67_12]|nr:MAG: hypothetical protein A2Z07_04705 [Armatimonadetes bacterium RBG_16_67_12]